MAESHTAARRQRDDLLRLLVDTVRDYAIFLLDTEGHVLTWNEGAARIKGYTAEEIVGKHFSVFYPPERQADRTPEGILRIAAAEGRFEGEDWRIRKDGSRFWASVVITALHGPDGELVGFAKVTRDLTERKRHEERTAQLLQRERTARIEAQGALERLQAIQSVTEAALAHLTLDDLLAELLGRIRDILDVDTVTVLLVAEDEDVLASRASTGLAREAEGGVRIPIGSGFAGRIARERRAIAIDEVGPRDVFDPKFLKAGIRSLAGVPLIVEGRVIGVLHVGSLRPRGFSSDDVAFLQIVGDRVALAIDHARLYETATKARLEADVAEATVKAQDSFLSIAAHELKTPMTSAKAAAQLLKRSFKHKGSLDPAQERAVDTIDRQIEKLGQLVVQLLETVRHQSGQLSVRPERTDLAALVRGVVAQVQTTTTRHDFVVSGPDPLWTQVDALRMEQVLQNLLDNAVKFSPEGGRLEIELSGTSGSEVGVAVRDRGLGVPPEHRERLFERFYQAHPDRSGLGLGLFITRQIVEGHGGTIWAEFPADGGTRFVLRLPADGKPKGATTS